MRLNLGTADVLVDELVSADEWQRAEVPEAGDMTGRYVLGLDLGTTAAMSAAAAFWPTSGRLECFAVFPELPTLAERGLGDGVGNAYVRMEGRGELMQAGRRVSDVGALLCEALHRWGRPAIIVADRWREGDLREKLEAVGFPPAALVLRGQGYKDGGEDVRAFRAAVKRGDVAVERSLLLRLALLEARTVSDPAGNSKLAKAAQGGRRRRARDDAAAAAILAVAEGMRRRDGWQRRTRGRRHALV